MSRRKKELTPRELLEKEFPCYPNSITIHSGIYEKESLYVPYLDRRKPDNVFYQDGLKCRAFNVTDADRKIFPELKHRRRIVLLSVDDRIQES